MTASKRSDFADSNVGDDVTRPPGRHRCESSNPNPPIDIAGAESAVRALLIALRQDPDAEHLRQTPHRVASAYAEMLTPREFDLTTFANDENYDQLVLALRYSRPIVV